MGAAVALVLLLASPSTALRPKLHPDPCHGQRVTASAFAKWSAGVWPLPRWERGAPKRSTIAAERQKLRCAAGPGHRKAIRVKWRSDRRDYYRHRRHFTRDWCSPHPDPEGDGCWVIPAWCVLRESGGSWSADNPTSDARGAYQLLGHGEPWPVTNWREAMEHHRIAAELYAEGGLGPWVAC